MQKYCKGTRLRFSSPGCWDRCSKGWSWSQGAKKRMQTTQLLTLLWSGKSRRISVMANDYLMIRKTVSSKIQACRTWPLGEGSKGGAGGCCGSGQGGRSQGGRSRGGSRSQGGRGSSGGCSAMCGCLDVEKSLWKIIHSESMFLRITWVETPWAPRCGRSSDFSAKRYGAELSRGTSLCSFLVLIATFALLNLLGWHLAASPEAHLRIFKHLILV